MQMAFDWDLGWVSEATFEGFARMHILDMAQSDPACLLTAAARLRKRCGSPRQASAAMQVWSEQRDLGPGFRLGGTLNPKP